MPYSSIYFNSPGASVPLYLSSHVVKKQFITESSKHPYHCQHACAMAQGQSSYVELSKFTSGSIYSVRRCIDEMNSTYHHGNGSITYHFPHLNQRVNNSRVSATKDNSHTFLTIYYQRQVIHQLILHENPVPHHTQPIVDSLEVGLPLDLPCGLDTAGDLNRCLADTKFTYGNLL